MDTSNVFLWWYAHGWGVFVNKLRLMISNIADFFSMDSLLRTLFKPYRQISAEASGTNVSVDRKFQMFIDRLISRLVGFFSRLILLMIGLVLIIVGGVISLVLIIIWPLIPLLPITGVVLYIMGFVL